MSDQIHDYIIVGAGAAGLHLALAMIKEPWFREKSILVLDRSDKNVNDKTWSYWEKGAGTWDHLVSHDWQKGAFITNTQELDLNLDPYRYKSIRSIDFYMAAREVLALHENVHLIRDEVLEISKDETPKVQGKKTTYRATHVFDSRIDQAFFQNKGDAIRVLQHFKGWFIKTEKPVFDPARFTMMDYRLQWKNDTSFTYVLPTSEHEALVEFTFFSPNVVDDVVYSNCLEHYIKQTLNAGEFEIIEDEQGIIPMTNYQFQQHNTAHITKIGTAGGWVKPSTGYSFRNAEKFARQVALNLRNGVTPARHLYSRRFRLYDTLFLDVLHRHNDKGEALFSTMYGSNNIQRIFSFLDQETTFKEELSIMASFSPGPFMKALMRNIGGI